ncbi:DUF6151 family protein [Massilia niastensis]|uniref:DUF6151 family protein n=1 Tax=Massilia niastensis TaxID=544911 RepID=UPI000594B5CA|nr:DUF6151 family protein [Massilia niastensis]
MGQTPHKIQCRCGQLEGELTSTVGAMHLACYCRDCQAYAHALGNPGQVLDELGGTDVIATLQHRLRFTKGADSLACLMLSRQGVLRWYASCCNTPIGNTARDPRLSYIGLVHTCMGMPAADLDKEFGTNRVVVNKKDARKPKRDASSASALFAIWRIIGSVVWARLNGSWKKSPFFQPGSTRPVAAPRVLSQEEREQAYEAVLPAK